MQRRGDVADELVVKEVAWTAPERFVHFLGLEPADVTGGAEDEPEVDVPVAGFALGGVVRDRVDVDVCGKFTRRGGACKIDAG